jgi:hypothetical protein
MLISNAFASLGAKKTQPGRTCRLAARPGLWHQLNEANYGFAAEAALDAASAAALAAAAASEAADAAASAAGAAAGGGSAAGAGASVLLPQALRTNAATKALRASLVFIYRYPRIFKEKFKAERVVLAHHQKSGPILEGFRLFSYLFCKGYAPETQGIAIRVKVHTYSLLRHGLRPSGE